MDPTHGGQRLWMSPLIFDLLNIIPRNSIVVGLDLLTSSSDPSFLFLFRFFSGFPVGPREILVREETRVVGPSSLRPSTGTLYKPPRDPCYISP